MTIHWIPTIIPNVISVTLGALIFFMLFFWVASSNYDDTASNGKIGRGRMIFLIVAHAAVSTIMLLATAIFAQPLLVDRLHLNVWFCVAAFLLVLLSCLVHMWKLGADFAAQGKNNEIQDRF